MSLQGGTGVTGLQEAMLVYRGSKGIVSHTVWVGATASDVIHRKQKKKTKKSTSPWSNLWSDVFTQLTEELRAKEGGGLREFSEGMITVIGARLGSKAENRDTYLD